MRVLAIDTATTDASVALRVGEQTLDRRLVSEGFHSTDLLAAIDALFCEAGLGPDRIDGIAVTIGPGSFTGLRVGIATAQGLALGAGCSLLPSGTLHALAQLPDPGIAGVIVVMDAFRGEVFRANASARQDGERSVDETRRQTLDEVLAELGSGACLVGNVARAQRERIGRVRPDVRVWAGDLFLARSMAEHAGSQLAQGLGVPPEEVRVDYGRGVHIGRPRPAA